jgi:20S proteasome alpha/beta subunit
MTICIAAMAGNEHVVMASDRMVTSVVPRTEFEQGTSKTLELAKNCLVATAGSALAYTPIYVNAKNQIIVSNSQEISQIADINRQLYMSMRNQKMEQDILIRLGLTLQNFYSMNTTLSPQIVAHATQAMSQYDYGLSILIAGVDSTGAHIYRIDNPARMEIFDALGHCSIGSGELHSISTFVASDYTATTATSNLAYAKISSTDTSCTNAGGNQPGGQQPSCTGGGLTQQTENQNPAGSAPPGQNK